MRPVWKVRIAVIATLFVSLAVVFCVGARFVLDALRDVERDEIFRDVQRARIAVQDYMMSLKGKCGDWAHWTEAYEFVAAPTTEWAETNAPLNSLVQLDLNLVAFLDAAGKTVFARAADVDSGNAVTVPPPFDKGLPPDSPLLRQGEGHGGVVGPMLVGNRAAFIAARPILTSEGQGPPRGTLVFARFADDTFTARLRALGHTGLSLVPFDREPLPRDYRAARDAIESFDDVHLRMDGERLAAYSLLAGLDGRPALLMRLENARDIQGRANEAVLHLLLLVLGTGIVCGAVLLLVVGRVGTPPASPAISRDSAVAP